MPLSPVISVVIPCFNHGSFLREALDSVGAPSHETEIIVVDDGSSDETGATAEAWAQASPTPVHVIRQPNQGLAAARNHGLRQSRGRYVAFLDADDRLAPGAIDHAAGALEEHPECFFVFGRCQLMSPEGALLPTPVLPRVVRDHYRELLRRNYIWMPAMVMFRREAVELAGGFNSAVDASADYELYLQIARHHPVFDHGHLVAYHRKHGTTLNGNASRLLRGTLEVLRAQRAFLAGDEASLEAFREGWRTWQEFYGTRLVNEIRAHVASGEWQPAVRKAVTLAHYHPRGLARHAAQKLRVAIRSRNVRLKPEATARR